MRYSFPRLPCPRPAQKERKKKKREREKERGGKYEEQIIKSTYES